MKLSRTAAYAIHATVSLAKHDTSEPVSCNQIVKDGNLPARFVIQILRALVDVGVLRSTCGVAGGYSFNRPADQITLADIVEPFEDNMRTCLPDAPQFSSAVETYLLQILERTTDAARNELAKITIAELASVRAESKRKSTKQSSPNIRPIVRINLRPNNCEQLHDV
jgi:Rrf2 family protein